MYFSGSEPVHVSRALQKAKVIVNEDGTKAAAATSEYFFSQACLSFEVSHVFTVFLLLFSCHFVGPVLPTLGYSGQTFCVPHST